MKKTSLQQEEIEFLKKVIEKFQDDPVVSDRLRYLFVWYTRKAQHNKTLYNLTRTITYLIPCLITLVSVYAVFMCETWPTVISATLSVILVFINHKIDHYRYYENWVRYRGTAERMKTEAQFFLSRGGDYAKGGDKKARVLFVNRIEQLASDELMNWENLQADSYQTFKDLNKEYSKSRQQEQTTESRPEYDPAWEDSQEETETPEPEETETPEPEEPQTEPET